MWQPLAPRNAHGHRRSLWQWLTQLWLTQYITDQSLVDPPGTGTPICLSLGVHRPRICDTCSPNPQRSSGVLRFIIAILLLVLVLTHRLPNKSYMQVCVILEQT